MTLYVLFFTDGDSLSITLATETCPVFGSTFTQLFVSSPLTKLDKIEIARLYQYSVAVLGNEFI